MQVQAHGLDPGQPPGHGVDRGRLFPGNAELVVLAAGADLLVRPGRHVRVDAQRHWGGRSMAAASSASRASSCTNSTLNCRMPRRARTGSPRRSWRRRRRRSAAAGPRPSRPGDLAPGDRVRAHARVREEADHREVAVGLHRVAEQDALAAEGVLELGHPRASRPRSRRSTACRPPWRSGRAARPRPGACPPRSGTRFTPAPPRAAPAAALPPAPAGAARDRPCARRRQRRQWLPTPPGCGAGDSGTDRGLPWCTDASGGSARRQTASEPAPRPPRRPNTRSGAVPPKLRRLSTDRSTPSTSSTPASRRGSIAWRSTGASASSPHPASQPA